MNNTKKKIKDLLKKADMPLWEGMSGLNDSSGLDWHRFQEGSFDIKKLPLDMVSIISDRRNQFFKVFEQFTNAPSRFKGMIFSAYAPDFESANQEAMAELTPEQKQTLAFAEQNNIVLSSMTEKGSKRIGSYFWFSHFGRAYQQQLGRELVELGSTRSKSVENLNSETQKQRYADQPQGTPQIMRSENGGLTIGLQGPNGPESMLGFQANQNMQKFFSNGLRPNQSRVAVARDGSIIPLKRTNITRTMSEEEVAVARESNERIQEIQQSGLPIYRLTVLADGTIAGQNIKNGAMRGFDENQILSMIKPEMMSGQFYIKPGITREEQLRNRGIVTRPEMLQQIEEASQSGIGNMGPFHITSEGMNQIMGDPSNPYSDPTSIAALTDLRESLASVGIDKIRLNAYRMVTIGPKFTNPQNLGQGRTTATPGFAAPGNLVNPNELSEAPEVNRGTSWVVLIDEHKPADTSARRKNPDRAIGNTGSQEFSTIGEAFDFVKRKFGDSKAFAVGERTLEQAEKALDQAMKMRPDDLSLPQQPQQMIDEVGEMPPQLPNNNIDDPNTGRLTSSRYKKLMRRFSKK